MLSKDSSYILIPQRLLSWFLSRSLSRITSRSVTVTTHVPEHATVEAVLGLQNLVDLRGRENLEEAVVIGLLNLLHLQFNLVVLTNGFLAGFLVLGHLFPHVALTVKEDTHLLLHLFVDREEIGYFLLCQLGFLNDVLLQFGIELLG